MALMQQYTPEEKRWCAALENAAVGLWDLSPKIDSVHYSPQWKALFGFGEVDAPDGTSFWRVRVHPDDVNPMLRALRLHLDGYTPAYEMRFRLRSAGFRYVPVLSRGRVVERDERGDATRMLGTMVQLVPCLPPAVAGSPHAVDDARLRLLRQVDDLMGMALHESAARCARRQHRGSGTKQSSEV